MHAAASRRAPLQQALDLRRAVHLVWHSAPRWTLASIVLLAVQGALPLLSLYLLKRIVDAVAGGLTASDPARAFAQAAWLIGLAGAIALLSALVRSLATLVSAAQAQVVTDHVQDVLHAKSIAIDLEYYENAQYYDTLHRAQRHALDRPSRILQSLLLIGQSGVTLLAIAGLLLVWLHWSVAAVLFLVAMLGAWVRWRHADTMYRWHRRHTPTERRVWYLHWLLTGDQSAKDLRLCGLGPLFLRQSQHLRQRLRREYLRLLTQRSAGEFIAEASQVVAIFGAVAFLAYRTVYGLHSIGELVMAYHALQRGQTVLQQLSSNLTGLYENSLFLSALYEFLHLTPKIVEPTVPQPLPRPLRTGIVFDQVSFQYPTGTTKVVEDLSFTIRPGEHVAFVGANGAGKTTLIKLLCRLYDPTEGRITIDGIDLRAFATTALRRDIAVLFQDYARYHHTANENIWFGNIARPPEPTSIVAAARQAGADELLRNLKYGYETILGKWFVDGEELSTGEWQKVALARVFLSEAQIIVLDEPTSALDAQAEAEVFERFHHLAKGRTAMLISHRLSTVRMADCIYVLESGKIVERGTHTTLMDRGGAYARLFATQAQYYQ